MFQSVNIRCDRATLDVVYRDNPNYNHYFTTYAQKNINDNYGWRAPLLSDTNPK